MFRSAPLRFPIRLVRAAGRTVLVSFISCAALAAPTVWSDQRTAIAADQDGAPVVTFTGLRVHKDGSATLFVELTRTTPVEVTHEGKNVSFLLSGAKVRWRNNKNPLLADHFRTNVIRAELEDSKAGVLLRVRLREEVHLAHDMGSSAVGARLRVEVPPLSQR